MRASISKLILWFTSDKVALVVVVPDIVALLSQLEHPQLVVSTFSILMQIYSPSMALILMGLFI
jgi:uncharacterized membrane protein YccC